MLYPFQKLNCSNDNVFMMKRFNYMLLLLCVVACQKTELPVYHGAQSLFLKKDWQTDVTYSFAESGTLDTRETTLLIPVIMAGGINGVKPFNYSIRFEADDRSWLAEAAEAGEMTYSFSGNTFTDTIRLRLIRQPELADTTLRMTLKLIAPKPYDEAFTDAESSDLYKDLTITVSDSYREGYNWSLFQPYLGQFSSKKMRTICREFMDHSLSRNEINQVLINAWLDDSIQDFGIMFRNYLETQAQQGTPVLEANGQHMTAGPLVY